MVDALATFVPMRFKRRKGRWLADGGTPTPDARIIDAVGRALYWQSLLEGGAYLTVGELARAEGLMPTTVGRMLRLALLAPDIVEQLMAGCQPRKLTLLWLMRNDIPALWTEQRRMLACFG